MRQRWPAVPQLSASECPVLVKSPPFQVLESPTRAGGLPESAFQLLQRCPLPRPAFGNSMTCSKIGGRIPGFAMPCWSLAHQQATGEVCGRWPCHPGKAALLPDLHTGNQSFSLTTAIQASPASSGRSVVPIRNRSHPGLLPALVDRPDNQALSAPHVARSKDPGTLVANLPCSAFALLRYFSPPELVEQLFSGPLKPGRTAQLGWENSLEPSTGFGINPRCPSPIFTRCGFHDVASASPTNLLVWMA